MNGAQLTHGAFETSSCTRTKLSASESLPHGAKIEIGNLRDLVGAFVGDDDLRGFVRSACMVYTSHR